MARVSKRNPVPCQQAALIQEEKIYKTALYARLSSDQDVKKNESIEIQFEIAEKFVEECNQKHRNEKMVVVERYKDLGKTGTNFNRDEFKRLLQDIRLGDINCVIVKDLSRFGRNYLEAGNYIEKIFPFLGVRFIAVADGYDTGEDGNNGKQMAAEIKNLVNEMYAKDFSAKAKVHLKQRREKGEYVGGPPPYGYLTGWKDSKRALTPDGNTAAIVKMIFQKFVETKSYKAVADELNRKKINPPSVYKKTKEVFCLPDMAYKGWDKVSVERIIKSRTYLGTLEQGKTSITAKDEQNRVHKEKRDWVIRENCHDPLIDEKIFEQAQKTVQEIRDKSAAQNHTAKDYPMEENIFDTVLYCGVCGKKMTRSSYVKTYADGRKVRLEGYFCSNAGGTKVDSCPQANRISKRELLDILLPFLQQEFTAFLKHPKEYQAIAEEKIHEAKLQLDQRFRSLNAKIGKAKDTESETYIRYRSQEMMQEEYVAFKLSMQTEVQAMEKQKTELEQDMEKQRKAAQQYKKAVRSLIKLKSGKELTKNMIEDLVERIHLYPGKRIEIFYHYTDEMSERGE